MDKVTKVFTLVAKIIRHSPLVTESSLTVVRAECAGESVVMAECAGESVVMTECTGDCGESVVVAKCTGESVPLESGDQCLRFI